MTTDPQQILTASQLPRQFAQQVQEALEGQLDRLTLRELLGMMLSSLGEAERRAYLAQNQEDKGNGHYPRSVWMGSIPVDVEVPRTRRGAFRPICLPALYQRGYPEETQNLLLGLLTSSRSINAAKAALKQMGLGISEQTLESVARELTEDLELRNTGPLDPDLLVLFLDGKYVEVREGDRLRPACVYVVVGMRRDGHKRVLACLPRFGRENLEDWKVVLRGLMERGLRRVLIAVQDDFTGLLPVTRSLFPQTDIQLCTVHMQRNATRHMSKPDALEFNQRLRFIKAAWTFEVAAQQFDDLCATFAPRYPSFITEIRKKRDHYLAFIPYPEAIRRTLTTTNAVEALNGQLENRRRTSGGYFQSTDALKIKLASAIAYLETGTWRKISATISSCLQQLNAMFANRFEVEQ